MQLKDLINFFENEFPLKLQEDYDNSGLQIGDKESEVKGVLVSLDCTEKVIEEAIKKECNVVVCHHPLLFKSIKKIAYTTEVERVIRMCIKRDISVYAIHTNLDNHPQGVNAAISDRIGLMDTSVLSPMNSALYKLAVYLSKDLLPAMDLAIFEAGGGGIGNYSECHFRQEGVGTFKPGILSNPSEGKIGIRSEVPEIKVDYLVEEQHLEKVLMAMRKNHIYEEVAHDIILLENKDTRFGAGRMGTLKNSCDELTFLLQLKEIFGSKGIRYSALLNKPIKKVALCGGAGSFLIKNAISAGVDCYITSDLKYHEFFDAEQQLLLIDLGHFESEQFTSQLLMQKLKENFTNFAIHLSVINTNPINYL